LEIVSLLKSGADDSFTLSPPKPVTYTELASSVNKIVSALIDIGFTDPSSPLSSRARVSIYADTSLRWQLMAQTFSRLGHVITTAYTTLGEEGLLRSLVEPDVEFVFCGEDQLGMVAKVVERAEKVKWVVYDADEARVDKVCLFHPFISVSSLSVRCGSHSKGSRGAWWTTPSFLGTPPDWREQTYSTGGHGSQADRGRYLHHHVYFWIYR
jgi:hypothetical protein